MSPPVCFVHHKILYQREINTNTVTTKKKFIPAYRETSIS